MTEDRPAEEPRGYWQQPENQPGHPRFWTPRSAPLPKGAMTHTARRSRWQAIIALIVCALQIVSIVLDGGALSWSTGLHAAIAIAFGVSAVLYLRSWRILLAHERRAGELDPPA